MLLIRTFFLFFLFFFFNDTATTEIYTLSLHDALPICITTVRFSCRTPGATSWIDLVAAGVRAATLNGTALDVTGYEDRKSTRLNSSHANISYAVFCLKKKKK